MRVAKLRKFFITWPMRERSKKKRNWALHHTEPDIMRFVNHKVKQENIELPW